MRQIMEGRGFSLIEMVIVILLAAILAAMVVAQLPSMGMIRVVQASNKLKSDIRFTQSYAVASRKRSQVSFNRAGNNYSVLYEPTAGSWSTLLNPLTKQNFTVNFGQGDYFGVSITAVNFGGADNNLVFDTAGAPYGYTGGVATALASNGTVTLSGGGVTRTVTVTPQTGKASAQ